MGVEPTYEQEAGPYDRFEDGSKAVPACSLLLRGVLHENEIDNFVRHRVPAYPTRVHGFAADFAANRCLWAFSLRA
jgi:hypothetical protein